MWLSEIKVSAVLRGHKILEQRPKARNLAKSVSSFF